MRMTVAVAIACLSVASLCIASESDAAIKHYELNIPRQALDAALKDFAEQTGLQIALLSDSIDGNTVVGPLTGQLSAKQALTSLLGPQGLSYKIVNDHTIAIIDPKSAGVPLSLQETSAPAVDVTDPLRFARAEGVSEPAAAAAESGSTAATSSNTDKIEEVVVTATKRKESLQKLPQAVTAITAERLDDLNAQSFQDYFRNVPGLMMVTDALGHQDFTIRGVSDFSTTIPQTGATVGQYIDEVPITTTGAQLDPRLVDVERIEVLRGPQGTYYGESSLGGTIRMLTKKPDLNQFSATAEGRIAATEHSSGTSDQESITLNVPLVQGRFALRGNYFNAQDKGYLDQVNVAGPTSTQVANTFKSDANSTRADGGRVMALLALNDSWTVLGEAMHTKTTIAMDSGYDPTVGDLMTPVLCPSPPPFASVQGQPNCFTPGREQSANLYNLTVNADFGWASLVSATSWAQTYRNQNNTPGVPGALAPAGDVTDGSAVTQELRLVSSPSWSDRWDYIVGAFGSRKHTRDVGAVTSNIGESTPIDQTNKEVALFGETGYKFSSHWNARLGARTVQLHQLQGVTANTLQGTTVTEDKNKFTPFTGRAVLNYIFNDDAMVYGSVSSGFRPGGSNIPSPIPGVSTPPSYDPDKTVNYELGWKLAFPSLRATLNGAVYHIDWKNMQSAAVIVSSGGPAVSYYRNVGDVKVDGFELESGMQLARGLSTQISFSYINARLAQDYALSTNPLILHGLKGDRIPFVAPISGSVSLNYRHPLGVGGFNGFGILNAQYQDKRKADFNKQLDNPFRPSYAVMDAYWTTGAQLGVESDAWRIALYADNLLDDRANLFSGPPNQIGRVNLITNRPRTVGMFLRYSFN